MAKLFTFEARDAQSIRDSGLRTMANGLRERGVPDAERAVAPGSVWFVLWTAIGNELAVAEANGIVKADEAMPDTASIDGLRKQTRPFGMTEQPAGGAVGNVIITASAPTTIQTGAQLIDDAGLRFRVAVGGPYVDGDMVPVEAIDTGDATNHEEGDILRWTAAPPFCDENATIGAGGLRNGVDAEDVEAFRERFYAKLRSPPRSGNPQHVADDAEDSTPSVQKAFVYPAVQGPGTFHVAVTAAPTATSKARDVASLIVSGSVKPYVQGLHPGRTFSVITSVTNVATDVAVAMTLPEAPTANPPGLGGGWKNGQPWPAPDGATTYRCTVTLVTSTTVFRVDATRAPEKGVSRIAWLSPFDWKLYTALVADFSGSSGAYVITLDRPFIGIAVGCYIWPDCENAQSYVDAILAAYALMGPGEKTDNVSLLAWGFRRPRPSTSWPSTLDAHLFSALTAAQPEIAGPRFLHRTDGTTTLTGPGGTITPQVPADVEDPPKQFIPRHLAFYRSS